jgi:hypothetical protein
MQFTVCGYDEYAGGLSGATDSVQGMCICASVPDEACSMRVALSGATQSHQKVPPAYCTLHQAQMHRCTSPEKFQNASCIIIIIMLPIKHHVS